MPFWPACGTLICAFASVFTVSVACSSSGFCALLGNDSFVFFSHRMTLIYIYVALLALCESLCFCLYVSVKGCSVTLRVALLQCVGLFGNAYRDVSAL